MGKTKKKKGPRPCDLVLGVLLALIWITPAQAQTKFGWSSQPLHFSFDHVAYTQDVNRLEGIGISYKAVYGALAEVTLGANTFEVGLLSLGMGVGNSEDPETPKTFGQAGFVVACTTAREICADVSYARSAAEHEKASYVVNLIYRFGAAVGMPPTPVEPTPAAAVPTGLQSLKLSARF